MKNFYKFIFSTLLVFVSLFANGQVTDVFTVNGSFTVPCGVTSIEVDCWGGGGAGGGTSANDANGCGGGAGGAHATKTFAVVAGQVYTVTVAGVTAGTGAAGTQGGTTTFTGVGGTVVAQGGAGGAGASGGAAATCGTGASNGTPVTAGANGGVGGAGSSGAGGAGAVGGGAGGASRATENDGANGSAPGGGGSGAYLPDNSNHTGGNGARGEVWVTYTAVAPANDAVCSATVLLVDGTTLGGQTNCGSTSLWSGGCVVAGETEVWYQVTITGANNTLTVNFPTNSFGGGNVSLQLVTNDVPCPANTSMTLEDDYCGTATGPITLNGFTAGTYFLGVSTTLGNQGAFTINATQSTVAAFPDDPCDAIVIASNYCSTATAHTNVGATGLAFVNDFYNNNACGDNRENEIYFKFVATTTSMDVTALQGSNSGGNAEITILQTTPDDTDCTDPYSVIASSCPAWGTVANFLDILTIGDTYYVVVDHNGNNAAEGTFGLCLDPYNFVPPVGTGFTCGTAIPITTPFIDISTTVGSGNDWNFSCGLYDPGDGTLEFGGTATEDKFYSLTVPAGGGYYDYSLSVRNTTLPVANSYPIVSFITACPGSNTYDFGDVLNTNSNSVDLCAALNDSGGDGQNSSASSYSIGGDIPCKGIWLPAGNYFIVIDHARNVSSTFNSTTGAHNVFGNYAGVPLGYQYQFEINDLAAAPNNECTGVANIVAGVTQNGNNMGCNYSYGPNDPNASDFCAISTENLAWFSFTTAAGQTTVDIALTNVSGDVQWGIVQGACGGPYTSAGANALNTPADGLSTALDPCDRVSTPTYNTTITGLTASTQYWFVADGNAGTPSSFDITMTNITLPIELIEFKAENKIDHITLDWSTASEDNNDYFSIERSYDGINFEKIAKVDGSGTSSSLKRYTLDDNDVKTKGLRYYRLKQIDFNGNYTYSEIVKVKLDNTKITISPNPIVSEIEINVESFNNNVESTLTILDITGKIIYSETNNLIKGVNTFKIDANNITSGVYFVKVESKDEIKNERFVKK